MTVYLFAQISLEMTSTTVCVIVPKQLSVTVILELFATGTSEAQLTVISWGTSAISGFIESFTVIGAELGRLV